MSGDLDFLEPQLVAGSLDDVERRAFQSRAMRTDLETETERVRRRAGEASDLESHDIHLRLSDLARHEVDEVIHQCELVHRLTSAASPSRSAPRTTRAT